MTQKDVEETEGGFEALFVHSYETSKLGSCTRMTCGQVEFICNVFNIIKQDKKDISKGDFDEAIDQTAGCLQVFIDFKANEQDMDERDVKKSISWSWENRFKDRTHKDFE